MVGLSNRVGLVLSHSCLQIKDFAIVFGLSVNYQLIVVGVLLIGSGFGFIGIGSLRLVQSQCHQIRVIVEGQHDKLAVGQNFARCDLVGGRVNGQSIAWTSWTNIIVRLIFVNINFKK